MALGLFLRVEILDKNVCVSVCVCVCVAGVRGGQNVEFKPLHLQLGGKEVSWVGNAPNPLQY